MDMYQGSHPRADIHHEEGGKSEGSTVRFQCAGLQEYITSAKDTVPHINRVPKKENGGMEYRLHQ